MRLNRAMNLKPLFLCLAFYVTGATPTVAQDQVETILQLDTGGHKARIRDVLVTSDQRYLVSASDDKTIRVWDTRSRKETRKILGQIGPGPEGMINAIALSPDDQFLAVGGFLGKKGSGKTGNIRIYDFPSGKLSLLLDSHTDVVSDLHFSADGRYLVSGSADDSVKVWQKESVGFLPPRTVLDRASDDECGAATNACDVYGVRIFQQGGDTRVASVGNDGKVRLFSLETGLLKEYQRQSGARYLALSDRFIAVAGKADQEIEIFDRDLESLHTITPEATSGTESAGLSFSPGGNWLLAGVSGKYPRDSNVYDTDSWQIRSSFHEHDNLAMAVTFLNDQTAITAGGDNNEIYFWDINSPEDHHKIDGMGQRVWSVGIRNDQVAFASTFTGSGGMSAFEKYFDLQQLSLAETPGDGFQRIPQNNRDYSLSHSERGVVLEIRQEGSSPVKIRRNSTNGFVHLVYGFSDDGTIISGGANGFLTAYDLEGKELASFKGHTGHVRGIAVQGDRLVSGGDDQTIKIWNLNDLGSSSEKHPLATLFVAGDGEWVLWTGGGRYVSSVTGDQYVGYHVNHGPEKEAKFLPHGNLFPTLYRKDIVLATLELGSEDQAIAAVSEATGTVARTDTAELLPPTVEIVSPAEGFSTGQNSVQLKAKVSSVTQEQIGQVEIKLNGRRLPGQRGVRPVGEPEYDLDEPIQLEPGNNSLEVIARNKHGKSNPARVSVEYNPSQPVDPPESDLYLLSIGVSEYLDERLKLNFADDDALALERIYKNQEGKLFKNVHIKVLTDREATRANVLRAFKWITDSATENDMAVVFVAGHGVNDSNDNYFFLTHEANEENMDIDAVTWGRFKTLATDLKSKRTLLLVDTCKSGGVTGNNTKALKDIVYEATGVVVMTASTGEQSSLENAEWGHGAFTKALVEGLENYQADDDDSPDRAVSLYELNEFVSDRVKRITTNQQHPIFLNFGVPDYELVKY
jgi:WD40 repeat protein